MGEYAEMMLDGTCCSQCGEFMDFDAPGFPGLCAGCRREEKRQPRVPRFNKQSIKPNEPKAGEIACPRCKRVVKEIGFGAHCRDAHGVIVDVNTLLIKALKKVAT